MSEVIQAQAVLDVIALVDKYGIDAAKHTVDYVANFPAVVGQYTFSLGGSSKVHLTEKQFQTVKAAYANGLNKIQAIKTFREITGVGLKEAKDAIETYKW